MRWKGGGRLGERVSGGTTGPEREAARRLGNTDAEASAASIMTIEEEEASSSSGHKHHATTSAEHDSSASSNHRRDSNDEARTMASDTSPGLSHTTNPIPQPSLLRASRGSSSSPWGRFGALTTIKKRRQHASTESSRAREQVTLKA